MDPDLKKAIDLSLADMASRNKNADGVSSMSLEAAVNSSLPNFNNMSEEEVMRYAIERSIKEKRKDHQVSEEEQMNQAIELSKKETAKETINSKEEEEVLLRNAIRESLELANQCHEDFLENEDQEAYQKNFHKVLQDNSELPKPTRSRKKKAFSGLPLSRSPSISPVGLVRIQGEQKEEEDFMEAIRRSRAEAVKNGIPVEPEVIDIADEIGDEDLKMAIELSKQDVSTTPPALDPPLPPPQLYQPSEPKPSTSASVQLPAKFVYGSSSGRSRIQPRTFREGISKNNNKKKGDRRPIVVDGCNVGWNYGRNLEFNAYGLTILYNYFIDKGWQKDEIVIFLKRPQMSDEDHACCESLAALGVLKYTPKRKAGNRNIVCDDDDMIIDYANQCGGIIISNDHYRDSFKVNPEFRDTITNRVLQANFINDKILFSRRPLGPEGPTIEEFLRF